MARVVGMAAAGSGLSAHLRERIGAEGPLSVAAFMEEALLHPRWGYYKTRDPLGARGDFITAPEISQVFGELIGLWCADYWQRMGAPDPVLLVELGPGRGTLMRDALRAAKVMPDFAPAARLHLVERSPVLRAVQATALGAYDPQWHDDLSTMPAGPMLLVANEFLDALPVRQFVGAEDGWHERRVTIAGDGFAFVLDDGVAQEPALGAAELGAIREIRPAARGLARELGTRFGTQGGAALFIDYGYAASEYGDTLQAMHRHRAQDALVAPGTADLTAHVDFADFAAAAREGGARAWGPVPQGEFLLALGIEERARRLAEAAPDEAPLILSACRRLVDPGAMGRLFKVLALGPVGGPTPAGFSERT